MNTFKRLENSPVVYFLLVLPAIALAVWGARFGLDFTDEPYSILFGWKLFSFGDHQFTGEIYSAAKSYDLLNYFLIHPWVPFSLPLIRISCALVYALLLFFFSFHAFKGRLGLTAGLVFISAFFLCTHE